MMSFGSFVGGSCCVKLRVTVRNGAKVCEMGCGWPGVATMLRSSECSLASERLLADLLSIDMAGDIAGVGGLLMLHL